MRFNAKYAALSRRELLSGTGAMAALPTLGHLSARSLLPPARPAAGKLRIQRLAWAGIKLELANTTLFVDPLLSPSVWGENLKQTLVPPEATTHHVARSVVAHSPAVWTLRRGFPADQWGQVQLSGSPE